MGYKQVRKSAKISFPLVFTGTRLGRLKYPKAEGKIQIYVADISKACKGNIPKIAREVNKTMVEELTHLYDESKRIPEHHYDKVLEA